MRTPVRGLAAVAVAAAALVSACGSSSGGGGSAVSAAPSQAVNTSIASSVPAKFKTSGLTIATDPSYAPNEFLGTNGTTITGMDVDLANALGQVLGVKVTVVKAGFDAIIPGLASGKYDVGLSSFTDTLERQKQVDFVTYFSAGTSFFTKASGGATVTSLDDLCGKKVAVEKGTTQETDATAQTAKCKAAGKAGVSVQSYPDQNGANLALSAGRADLSMADSPVADYQVKLSKGQFKTVGTPYGTAPYGIALPKNSGLSTPVLGAVKELIANGTYKTVLTKWGVADGAITDPKINGATS
ncbi:MAG: ABC transporter substrate-binding protein [Frankia sp.]